jgi:diaminopimelate decarboxylase
MPKQLTLDHEQLRLLAEDYATPYQLYDGDLIKVHAIKYMETFRKHFPRFKQYFAVKATPNPSILLLLKSCGMGFDCASVEEIEFIEHVDKVDLMLNLNNIKSEILFTSNYTAKSDIEFALNSNSILNLDSIDALQELFQIPNWKQKTSIISFRYNPKSLITKVQVTSNDFSGANSKFGLDKSSIIAAYEAAKCAGIENFGLHIMAKSCVLDINYWADLIDTVYDLIAELYQQLNITIKFLDIGGGIGIPYKPDESDINLDELVELLRKKIDENMKKYNLPVEPELYTECGRYITGKYGWLVAECKSIKVSHGNLFYGLNASMANLMRPGMYGAYHHIEVPEAQCRAKNNQNLNINIYANVVGTLCENNDWFAKFRALPSGIKKGDLFVIHDTGAHGYSMGFNYNSKLRCAEILKLNGSYQCIRDRETFTDLIRNCSTYGQIEIYICSIAFLIFEFIFLAILFNY